MEKTFGISFIIAAYNTANYIEQAIQSINDQNWCKHNNYEILVGVDGCEKTLLKCKELKNKYSNLIIFDMQTNMGTFVTANTLIKESKYSKIIRFDSDDFFTNYNSIDKIMENANEYNIIRYFFNDYHSEDKISLIKDPAYGSVLYDTSIFIKAGGYQAWRCQGDYEFFQRVKNHFTSYIIKEPIYNHRIREDSLMHAKETSMESEYRLSLAKQVKEYEKDENIYIEPIINNNYKII